MKKVALKSIISRVFVSILVVILIVFLPLVSIKQNDNLENIFSVFLGAKAKYQGIIEIWNIDTFEGGSAPKSNYLTSVASSFEKKNKGIYVMIKNLTEFECLNLLYSGYKPDLFSCSYGVASEIKNYIEPLDMKNSSAEKNIMKNLLSAGKIGNEQYGVPWCFGLYFLISSTNHLKKADFYKKNNIEESSDFKLSDYYYSLGYEKKLKKSVTTIYSLSYGKNEYLRPDYALKSYNNKGFTSSFDYFLSKNVNVNTQYDAYVDFISNKSVMLLGTQRDIFRLNGRVENGKLSDILIQPITSFTDLVQFIFLSSSASEGDSEKKNYCQMFIECIISEENQNKLSNVGLFSVCKNCTIKSGIMSDIEPYFFSDLAVNNVFISKSEIVSF